MRAKNLRDLSAALKAFEKALKAFGNDQRGIIELSRARYDSLTNFAKLIEKAETPSKLPLDQKLLWSVENLKRRLIKQDPLPAPKADIGTQRFFAENYLRLIKQMEILNKTYFQIEIGLRLGRYPTNPKIVAQLEIIQTLLDRGSTRLTEIQPTFNEYMLSLLSK